MTGNREPRNLRKAIDIIILGGLGMTQDEIVDIVHCGKQTVVRYQQWFRELPYERARSLVPDDRIKCFLEDDFVRMAHPDQGEMARALERRLTGDSVLLYYGHSSAPGKTPEVPQGTLTAAHSLYADLLGRHWNRLRKLTEALREQTRAPTPRMIFTADVCRRLYAWLTFKAPLVPSGQWNRLFEAPIILKQSSRKQADFAVRLPVECENLSPRLTKHLDAEDGYSFAVGLGTFVLDYHIIVSQSIAIMEKVVMECPRVTLARYTLTDAENGLRWDLPAYLCRYLLAQYAGKPIPWIGIFRSLVAGVPQKLAPQDQLFTLTLAQEADYQLMQRHLTTLSAMVNRMLQEEDKLLRSLNLSFFRITRNSTDLVKGLSKVIERGDYLGSCDICQRFLEILSLSPERKSR